MFDILVRALRYIDCWLSFALFAAVYYKPFRHKKSRLIAAFLLKRVIA
jgi:hypothetical protein